MDEPALIAHRGYAGAFPENTVGAASAATADPRTDGIEIDVRACRGGEPVVFHDARLDRRDDGSPGLTALEGLVRETPLETVTAAEVLDSGWRVPRLETLCAALPEGTFVTIELKNPGTADVRRGFGLPDAERAERRRRWAPFVERTAAILERFDLDVRFGSFCEAAVAETRDRGYETVPICAADHIAESVEFASRRGCPGVHVDLESLAGAYRGAAPDFDAVAACREANLEVVGWTARTWHDARRMVDIGADGVVADYPSLLEVPRRSIDSADGSGGPRR